MRNPVRSETDAFYLAIGGSAVIGACLALGALVSPAAGIALFVGALAGAFVWEVATKDPDRRRRLDVLIATSAAGRRLEPMGARKPGPS